MFNDLMLQISLLGIKCRIVGYAMIALVVFPGAQSVVIANQNKVVRTNG